MNRYTIHCTQEQTEKALELGAPISNAVGMADIVKEKYFADGKGNFIILPTAEQMINWLEEQRLFIHIDYDFHANDKPYKCEMCLLNGLTRHCGWFTSREEATIAGIDAALNHLIQH